MQFNSLEFLVFFFIVVNLYFALPYRFRWVLLLAASYWFYMAWNPAYIILIIASTLIDYSAGLRMSHLPDRQGRRKYLILSLMANLGLLFAFKYYNFFRLTANAGFSLFGIGYESPYLDVLLPVGISFYTFQTLSYTIEVYRGNQVAERHLGRFALYVAFFPQLVAGPIERSVNLLPELAKKFDFDYERVRSGLILMLWGLFKKIVVADRLAAVVDKVYGTPDRYPGMFLTIGTVFFAFQIYCDFSGYSDIAIGAARVLGIKLMRNFNRPYIARNVAEFWHRWHISLSTWFRDYLFIPLGGSRVSTNRLLLNLFVVFTVSGLWHGANWTFIAWGALHGTYYVVGMLTRDVRERMAQGIGLTKFPRVHGLLQTAVTFVLVCVAWVFFRADTIHDAGYVLRHMGHGWWDLEVHGGFTRLIASMDISVRAFALSCVAIAFVLVVERMCDEKTVVELISPKPYWLRWAFYVGLGFAIINLGIPADVPFVYFQF